MTNTIHCFYRDKYSPKLEPDKRILDFELEILGGAEEILHLQRIPVSCRLDVTNAINCFYRDKSSPKLEPDKRILDFELEILRGAEEFLHLKSIPV